MREYERFNTVVANAYIKPLMKPLIWGASEGRLRGRRRDNALCFPDALGRRHYFDSRSAADFPVRLVESGPAGGAPFLPPTSRRATVLIKF